LALGLTHFLALTDNDIADLSAGAFRTAGSVTSVVPAHPSTAIGNTSIRILAETTGLITYLIAIASGRAISTAQVRTTLLAFTVGRASDFLTPAGLDVAVKPLGTTDRTAATTPVGPAFTIGAVGQALILLKSDLYAA